MKGEARRFTDIQSWQDHLRGLGWSLYRIDEAGTVSLWRSLRYISSTIDDKTPGEVVLNAKFEQRFHVWSLAGLRCHDLKDETVARSFFKIVVLREEEER